VHQVEGLGILHPARLVEELVQVSELGPGLIDGLCLAPEPIGARAGAVHDVAALLTA
jgi:hypothetical protein